jgi:hypothetical protein
MESIVGLQWAYSNKRQSAYATPNPDVDIDQSHSFEGADIADHVPNTSDNAALLGKGHEFATRLDLLSWDLRFRRSFRASTKNAGWAFAFHLGDVQTTGIGGVPTAAYSHLMEYQDPDGSGYYGSGRQQPVSTILEKVTSGLVRKFPSVQVMAVELTGTQGDWAKLAVECIGSGRKMDGTGFSFPEAIDGEPLRVASLLFEHGVDPSLTDVSCDVRSFRFRTEHAYAEADGYCPGSGYQTSGDPTSGQIRNKLETTRRAIVLEWVVRASSDNTLFTRLEGSIETAALITLTGSAINGSADHQIIISIPKIKYRAVPIGSDGDVITYTVQAVLLYDVAIDNPFTVTVVNTTSAYLVSS